MLHLIQKLDRGRWKTVAIATDSGTGHDRLDRAVGMAPTARFRLIAMVEGVEQLVRQVEPRLRDLLPSDSVSTVIVPIAPSQPAILATLTRSAIQPASAVDPFIPPPAEIPVAPLAIEPARRRVPNPLRLALHLGGVVILLAVLIDNIGTVSNRMRIVANPPATTVLPPLPSQSTPQLISPVLTPSVPAASDLSELPPAKVAIAPNVAVVEEPAEPPPAWPLDFAPEPLLIEEAEPQAPSEPPASLSIADCRALAQAQARFASRVDPTAQADAGPDRVDGADLQFRTLLGDWRTIQYRCHAASLGGVQLTEIRLR